MYTVVKTIPKGSRIQITLDNGISFILYKDVYKRQQQTFANNENNGLFGEGVIVGIADSGIDFTHEAFRNQDGTTRILNLWDQTNDRVYNAEEINEALKSENPYESVNSVDYSGHGTHVAGIAAGNFAENKNDNLGIATKSSLVIVKMALAGERSFPRTTQLMEAVDYMIKAVSYTHLDVYKRQI